MISRNEIPVESCWVRKHFRMKCVIRVKNIYSALNVRLRVSGELARRICNIHSAKDIFVGLVKSSEGIEVVVPSEDICGRMIDEVAILEGIHPALDVWLRVNVMAGGI